MSINDRLKTIKKTLVETAENCGRNPQSITIMPVTKTINSQRIIEAIQAGYPLIGENKVQEILDKSIELSPYPHEIHLIGHLQTNKVKHIVDHVTCIQSVDSLKLAEKLQARLAKKEKTMNIYIQVNTAREDSKFGIAPENLDALIKQIMLMENIHIKGLMTIGAHTSDEIAIRQSFKTLRQLQEKVRDAYSHYSSFNVLSMGMSHDWKIAVEEGATLLRIGSAIFGDRIYS